MPRGFTFNADVQRFRSRETGRFVSPATVRAEVDKDIEASKARMQSLARQLQSGAITVTEFQDAITQEVKDLHLAEVAMARGGRDRMRPSDYGRAGQRIRFHYEALQGLIDDIESNPDYIHGVDGRMDFVERVGMYAEAGRGTFSRARDEEMKAAGFRSKGNKLDAGSQHCIGDKSCIEMTKLGRVAIDDRRYLLEGHRRCITKCKCETQYWKASA